MTRLQEDPLREFQGFALTAPAVKSLMERISQRLHETMTRYNVRIKALTPLGNPTNPRVCRRGPSRFPSGQSRTRNQFGFFLSP